MKVSNRLLKSDLTKHAQGWPEHLLGKYAMRLVYISIGKESRNQS